MKKIKYIAFILASLLAVCACENEISGGSDMQEGEVFTKTFRATFADLTKTAVSSTGRVSWQAGDEIKYYSTNGGAIGTFTVEKDTSAIELTANVGKDDIYIVAVYGGSSITANKGTGFTLDVPSGIDQNGTFEDAHISVARTANLLSKDLLFHNVSSMVKFTLNRDDISKVAFRSCDDFHTIASDKYDICFDDKTDAPTVSMAGTTSYYIYASIDGPGVYYLSLMPQTLKDGFYMICYDNDGNRVGAVLYDSKLELEPGNVINLGVIDDRIKNYPTPVYDGPVVDMTIETANCYIVRPDSTYTFCATVQGNSTDPIEGTPVAAKVLWESFGNAIKPQVGDVVKSARFNKDDGTITVVTNQSGNAVVAIVDWDSNILWSWHIWVTDYDPSRQCNSYPWTATDYMMDRNLGALSATPGDVGALGLLYQWGRKDPFLGSSSIGSSSRWDSIVAASTLTWPVAENASDHIENNSTLAYSIANPTVFIKGSSNDDWYCMDSSYRNDNLWSSQKSKYDPCPAGWRVPDIEDNGPWARFPNKNDWDENWKGMVFGAAYCGSDVWYPAAGFRRGNDGSLLVVGYCGYYWSCALSSIYNFSYGLNFDRTGNVFTMYYYYSYIRAFGQSVRCQSE